MDLQEYVMKIALSLIACLIITIFALAVIVSDLQIKEHHKWFENHYQELPLKFICKEKK